MEAPDPVDEPLRPPGRLRVERAMDRLAVRIPPYFRRINRNYAIFSLGYAACFVGYWLAEVVRHDDRLGWDTLIMFSALSAFSLGVPLLAWLYCRFIAHLARSGAAAPAYPAALLGAMGAIPLGAFFAWVVSYGWALYCLPPAAFLVCYTAMVRRAVLSPVLTLDGSNLEIRDDRGRQVLPLESLPDLASLPALRGLTDGERYWLIRQVQAHSERLRGALARQGHDLAAPAAPPPDLLAQVGRS